MFFSGFSHSSSKWHKGQTFWQQGLKKQKFPLYTRFLPQRKDIYRFILGVKVSVVVWVFVRPVRTWGPVWGVQSPPPHLTQCQQG